jgi:hypothetical protein
MLEGFWQTVLPYLVGRRVASPPIPVSCRIISQPMAPLWQPPKYVFHRHPRFTHGVERYRQHLDRHHGPYAVGISGPGWYNRQ